MFRKILLALGLVVLAFVVVVALQPSDYRIDRSIAVSAPPADAFAQVNDLHHFQVWNPWAKLDPEMKTSFEGPRAGIGAVFEWSGNNQVGAGRMTVIESRPHELVRIKLDFLEPFPSTATADFTFQPVDAQTLVTWSMYGERTFVPKAVGLFMDMDKMLGGFFEQGLADMKPLAEAAGRK